MLPTHLAPQQQCLSNSPPEELSSPSTTSNRMAAGSTNKLIVCSLGIFVCYFYYGILQEKITRSTYGDGGRFTYTTTLVFIQCVINAIFAKIMLHTLMKQGEDHTRQSYYSACAFSYLGGMLSSNMALQYVNYPTQVIGKSCKPIPVMILGVLIGRKRYPLAKYFFVLLIVIGIGLFMYKDRPAKVLDDDEEAPSLIGFGEILLLISLALDGFTGAIQERMKLEYQSKSGHMMYYINLWSVLFLGIGVLLSGELWPFLGFVEEFPYIIYNIMLFSVTSALGQMFIFLTVSDFGPLPCSIITTTRKFFTVLGSVLIFGNPMFPRQWLGTVLVFAGLILDSVYGKQRGDPKSEKKEKT